MLAENTFKLFLKEKEFSIPSNFRYLITVDPGIYKILSENHSYNVKSDVNERIFQLFIDYWVNRELPSLNNDNISEYEKLSDEFDIMNDIIQIYKNKAAEITRLENDIETKDEQLNQNKLKYKQSINYIINLPEFKPITSAKNFSNECFYGGDLKEIKLESQKKIEKDGIIYSLNDYNFTATIFNVNSIKGDILIPTSVCYKLIDYTVISIFDNSFSRSEINSIQFEENSELKEIGKFSFNDSSIQKITIPKHVKKISKCAFKNCDKLVEVNFSPDSELEIIEENAFENCDIKTIDLSNNLKLRLINKAAFNKSLEEIILPSTFVNFQKSFKNVLNLKEFKIKQNNEFFRIVDNEFLVGKSEENGENFDLLILAKKDLKNAVIPSFIKRIAPYSFSNCLRLEKVTFSDDSQLEVIDDDAFADSSFDEIIIPSKNLVNFNSCFRFSSNLKTIKLSKENKNFQFIDDKFLIGKSDIKNENFDVLIFARRDIEHAVIPSYIKHISPFAFYSCTKLKKITFSDDSQLLSIGKYAFIDTNINSFSIPRSTMRIGKKAFFKTKLTSIFIPQNVIQIGEAAFSDCTSLKSVTFSDKIYLTTLEKQLFSMTLIESIVIPSSVKLIDKECFSYCENLQKVDFHDDSQLKIIGDFAFQQTKLKSITIPRHVVEIKEKSFDNCRNLQEFNFSNDSELRKIEDSAFYRSRIKQLKIPPHVTSLDCSFINGLESVTFSENCEIQKLNGAFGNSFDLESVKIPPSTKEIESAFSGSKIKEIIFPDNCQIETIENTFSLCDIEKLKIPKSVKVIKANSFLESYIDEIEFPEDSELEVIDMMAFSMSHIIEFTIPASVVRICEKAFESCRELEVIKFAPNSRLKIIEKGAFYQTSLITIEIPASVVEIEDGWNEETPNLSNISVSPDNKYYKMIDNNKIMIKKLNKESDIFDALFCAQKNVEKVTIPSYIKIISPFAFCDCESLVSVDFEPNSQLEIISESSFQNSGIETIQIPSSVVSIGESSFDSCKKLSHISIPSSVEELKIGWCNFTPNLVDVEIIQSSQQNFIYFNNEFILGKSDLNSDNYDVIVFARHDLEVALIPNFIKKIGEFAFNGLTKLKKVEFDKNSHLEIIDKFAFSNCVNLIKIEIPSSVTDLCFNCFSYCNNLVYATFHNDSRLRSINDFAFFGTKLLSFQIPNRLICIGKRALEGNESQVIEIPDDSQLKEIDICDFNCFVLFVPKWIKICNSRDD